MRFKDIMGSIGEFVVKNAPKVLDYARESFDDSVKNYDRENDRKVNDLERRVSSAEASAHQKPVAQQQKIKEARKELESKKGKLNERRGH